MKDLIVWPRILGAGELFVGELNAEIARLQEVRALLAGAALSEMDVEAASPPEIQGGNGSQNPFVGLLEVYCLADRNCGEAPLMRRPAKRFAESSIGYPGGLEPGIWPCCRQYARPTVNASKTGIT